jgi:hypothetical protein
MRSLVFYRLLHHHKPATILTAPLPKTNIHARPTETRSVAHHPKTAWQTNCAISTPRDSMIFTEISITEAAVQTRHGKTKTVRATALTIKMAVI